MKDEIDIGFIESDEPSYKIIDLFENTDLTDRVEERIGTYLKYNSTEEPVSIGKEIKR
jgi:hypothetical protein